MNLEGNMVNVSNIMSIGVVSGGISGDAYYDYPDTRIWIFYLDGGSFSFKIFYAKTAPKLINQIWNVIGRDKSLISNDYMILNKEYIANIETKNLEGYYLNYVATIHTTYGRKIMCDYEYKSDMEELYRQMG